eukprot:3736080-Pyramimonas_sp.AAC.1
MSWSALGPSRGPRVFLGALLGLAGVRSPRPGVPASLAGTWRDPVGTLQFCFPSLDPQGPPRTREL